jgi:hypothetical protein
MQDLAGFFFTGAGTVPGFLFYAERPMIAIMAMMLLLLAGCMSGMADAEAPFRTAKVRRPDETGR